MKNSLVCLGVAGVLVLVGCTGDDTANMATDGGTSIDSSSGSDGSTTHDSGNADTSPADGGADTATTDSSTSDGATDAAADGASDGATPDAGLLPLNGCDTADFADHTAALDLRTIAGPQDGIPAQYSPPCMKISAGQSVTWTGDFTDHPLTPQGGSSGNPITMTSTGITTTVAFPTAGVYGFECANHPGAMRGAILVQ